MAAARDLDTGDSATPSGGPRATEPDPERVAILEFSERERTRIGFDLHDGPVQTMSAALLQAKMLDGLEGEELASALIELRAVMKHALDEMYELIEYLRSRSIEEVSLEEKIGAWVRSFSEHSGIPATFRREGPDVPVSQSLQIAVFRIVQEALSNVRRHARADHVDVILSTSPEMVTCTVIDNGEGFEGLGPGRRDGRRHSYGLVSMRERARMLDGECEVVSNPGVGTRVEVRIPVWRG